MSATYHRSVGFFSTPDDSDESKLPVVMNQKKRLSNPVVYQPMGKYNSVMQSVFSEEDDGGFFGKPSAPPAHQQQEESISLVPWEPRGRDDEDEDEMKSVSTSSYTDETESMGELSTIQSHVDDQDMYDQESGVKRKRDHPIKTIQEDMEDYTEQMEPALSDEFVLVSPVVEKHTPVIPPTPEKKKPKARVSRSKPRETVEKKPSVSAKGHRIDKESKLHETNPAPSRNGLAKLMDVSTEILTDEEGRQYINASQLKIHEDLVKKKLEEMTMNSETDSMWWVRDPNAESGSVPTLPPVDEHNPHTFFDQQSQVVHAYILETSDGQIHRAPRGRQTAFVIIRKV